MEQLPEGTAPEEANFVLMLDGPDGPVEREANVGELLGQARALDDLVPHCEECPANVLGAAFGCVAYVHYPIAETTERALVERLQPADTLGGTLALQAIADFGYDGAAIEAWRSRGLFEATTAPATMVGELEVNGNVLFQALFGVGAQLVPTHCALLMIWVGALMLDGAVPEDRDPTSLQTLVQLTPDERAIRTDVQPTGDEMADLILEMLHRAYVRDVPLWVDA
ncbi:MAG: hypothetical protein KTR31_30930 [Myxococcales bacterium]|nr:hypothetical protein [Myxococcales bacterium]